jgi:alpha-galactosidase
MVEHHRGRAEAESEATSTSGEIVAFALARDITLDAAHPAPEWRDTAAIAFCDDWQGKNPDPARQTAVCVLWSLQNLYLRFECRYRGLSVFADSDSNGRRDYLWERDVAEAFLQPDPSRVGYYKEFEVAPNGFWLDLDVSPGPLRDLKSGLRSSVWLNEPALTWAAELAIPIRSLTDSFDPSAIWRANFYRVEGPKEPRTYLAWRATNTPQPNFHVPSAFGRLRFAAQNQTGKL